MRCIVAVITALILLSLPSNSFCAGEDHKYFDVYGGAWSVKGAEASWKTRWDSGGLGTGYSELEWTDLDTLAYMIGAKVKPYFYFLDLDFHYIGGRLRDGKNTDTDWIEGSTPFSISTQDTDGHLRYWSADLGLLLYPYRGKPKGWAGGAKRRDHQTKLELIFGYFDYQLPLRLVNGVQTVPATGRFAGLRSTYDFEWAGYKTGLRFKWDFIKMPSNGLHALGLNFAYSYLWGIEYRGEGYWNLRGLHFTHEADDGTGTDFAVSLFYRPLKNLRFVLGHRWLDLEARNGYDYRNGVYNSDLVEVKSSSAGWFLTLGHSF